MMIFLSHQKLDLQTFVDFQLSVPLPLASAMIQPNVPKISLNFSLLFSTSEDHPDKMETISSSIAYLEGSILRNVNNAFKCNFTSIHFCSVDTIIQSCLCNFTSEVPSSSGAVSIRKSSFPLLDTLLTCVNYLRQSLNSRLLFLTDVGGEAEASSLKSKPNGSNRPKSKALKFFSDGDTDQRTSLLLEQDELFLRVSNPFLSEFQKE